MARGVAWRPVPLGRVGARLGVAMALGEPNWVVATFLGTLGSDAGADETVLWGVDLFHCPPGLE